MSAYKIQKPGNDPEESIQHLEHGESLKSRIINFIPMLFDSLNTSSKNWDRRFDHWCVSQPCLNKFFATFLSSISCSTQLPLHIHGTV